MNRIAALIVAVVIVLAALVLSMRAGLWAPKTEDVLAKYTAPPSKFVDINGIKVHLRDEGSGPVVVMVHSSMTDLNLWNGVADILKKNYRVIRYDWPPYGFSTDPKEDFGTDKAAALLGAVVDHLNISQFTIVASSSGATLSVVYAAAHPERISGLALSSLPLELPPSRSLDWRVETIGWAHRNLFPNYYPRFYYDLTLPKLVGDVRNLKPEIVDWYYETNNIPDRQRRVSKYIAANQKGLWKKGAIAEAAQIEKPILLQWGDSDPVLPANLGDKAAKDFAKAQVKLIHYKDVGHYPMIEIPEKMADDLEIWLDNGVAVPLSVGPP